MPSSTASGWFDTDFNRNQIENKWKLAALERDTKSKYGFGDDSTSGFNGSGSGSNSSSATNNKSSNLFGLGGEYGALTDQAKDLARFRLGLDKEQADFSYGLRDKEAEGNFGRQYKLNAQQYDSQKGINLDTQSAMNQRLESELQNRLQQQDRGINQENFATGRAIRLASRRLGQR